MMMYDSYLQMVKREHEELIHRLDVERQARVNSAADGRLWIRLLHRIGAAVERLGHWLKQHLNGSTHPTFGGGHAG